MNDHGNLALRIAMGVVFIWFGALKPLGCSPAEELVALTTFWIPIPNFCMVLGFWEIAIGICFLYKPFIRIALVLLFLHMPGTMLPFVLLPGETFAEFPFGLTLEGQYIVKNLVLIGAAIVIGGRIRHNLRGPAKLAPDALMDLIRQGHWSTAESGSEVRLQGFGEQVLFIYRGKLQVDQNGASLTIGEGQFLHMNAAKLAMATAVERTHYLHWDADDLAKLTDDRPDLQDALQMSLNLDLITKLQTLRNA